MSFEIREVVSHHNDQQGRKILQVKGVEIDIIADEDGVVVTVQTEQASENSMLAECSTDWPS